VAIQEKLYIGLMSGTSLDGVDGVLADFSDGCVRIVGYATVALPQPLRDTFHALNSPGENELHRAAMAGNALAEIYSAVVHQLLGESGTTKSRVAAIGAHGQTIRHLPRIDGGVGYTLQINQAALLAERCGIDVIADFRSRDVAAGGQGAPLVPPFHQAVFGAKDEARAVLNMGGIANVTLLSGQPDGALTGFDCGPANTLLDLWCRQNQQGDFDADGAWARAGRVHPGLLAAFQTEPFFHLPSPKSTGRDLFNAAWLQAHLQRVDAVSAQDVQATLVELSAWAVAHAIGASAALTVIACGGGVRNGYLMERLQAHMPQRRIATSDTWGLPAQQVEACAFAWLARQHDMGYPASNPEVTGASGARLLGARYPA
jgi:anhydro-N-acetylmuramic acid kinase